MKTLIYLAIVWLLWLITPKQWKQRVGRIIVVMLITMIVITSPAFIGLLNWGLTIAVPPDTGDRVDAIVVLGRGPNQRESRLVEALQLWEDERASSIFVSGMMDAKPMVRYLKDTGIPISSLAGEECSQTTEENGLFTSAILRPQGVKDILLVTDHVHMWRSLLTFRSVGFNVSPYPISLKDKRLSNNQHLLKVSREYAGMAYYYLTGKFQERLPNELDNPPTDIIRKIAEWNCNLPRLKSSS